MFGTGTLALTDPEESDGNAVNPFASNDDEVSDKPSNVKNDQTGQGYGSLEDSATKSPDHGSLWTLPTPATSLLGKSDDSKGAFFGSNDKIDDSKEEEEEDKEEDGVMDEVTFHEKTGRPREPTRHCVVRFFFTMQSFGIITNLILLVSQILPIIFVPVASADMSYLALKVYLCVFSIIFLLIEFDHPAIPFLRKASFLKTFASRGFLYTFLGLVCFDEANSEAAFEALEDEDSEFAAHFQVSWFALFNVIAAWSLIGLGVLYFLMGIVCLQKIRNRYVYDDRQKWKAYREALEKWDHDV